MRITVNQIHRRPLEFNLPLSQGHVQTVLNISASFFQVERKKLPAYSDTLIINIPAGSASDPAGNQNTTVQYSIFYSTYPAVLSITPAKDAMMWKDTLFQLLISDKLDNNTITTDNVIINIVHSSSVIHTIKFIESSQITLGSYIFFLLKRSF